MKTNNYRNVYNQINAILHQETPSHLLPCTQVVRRVNGKSEPLSFQPPKKAEVVRHRKTAEKKFNEQRSKNPTDESGLSANYFVDTFNCINDYFNKGLWILSIEYTYSAIKQALNHCSKKINPAGYNDLYQLKSHFFNHIAEHIESGVCVGTNGTYMYDLINTTFVLLVDYFATNNSHLLTTQRVIIENLGYDISRQLKKSDSNYRLHIIFCNLYHKIYRHGYKSLSRLQYVMVKKARANYRLKDDIISRISTERRSILGFETNLAELIKQSTDIESNNLDILINDINNILKDMKPSYRKIFLLKLKGLTFDQISSQLGYTNESGSRKVYNKAIAILRESLQLEKYQHCDSIDIYNLTTTIDID